MSNIQLSSLSQKILSLMHEEGGICINDSPGDRLRERIFTIRMKNIVLNDIANVQEIYGSLSELVKNDLLKGPDYISQYIGGDYYQYSITDQGKQVAKTIIQQDYNNQQHSSNENSEYEENENGNWVRRIPLNNGYTIILYILSSDEKVYKIAVYSEEDKKIVDTDHKPYRISQEEAIRIFSQKYS